MCQLLGGGGLRTLDPPTQTSLPPCYKILAARLLPANLTLRAASSHRQNTDTWCWANMTLGIRVRPVPNAHSGRKCADTVGTVLETNRDSGTTLPCKTFK